MSKTAWTPRTWQPDAERVALYAGRLVSNKRCHAADYSGLVCGSDAITDNPVPLCRTHVEILHRSFSKALEACSES